MHVAHLFQIDWSSVLNFQDDVVEIGQALDVTAASDEKLGRRYFERFAADILITHPDRVDDIANRDVISGQLVRIEIDLILFDETANRRDLGHTFHRFQRVPDIPILERTQRRQIMFAALVDQRVLVNPTDSGRVRSDNRIDALRQRSANRVQILDHPRSSPINVRTILKDDVNERFTEIDSPRTNLTFGAAMNLVEIG